MVRINNEDNLRVVRSVWTDPPIESSNMEDQLIKMKDKVQETIKDDENHILIKKLLPNNCLYEEKICLRYIWPHMSDTPMSFRQWWDLLFKKNSSAHDHIIQENYSIKFEPIVWETPGWCTRLWCSLLFRKLPLTLPRKIHQNRYPERTVIVPRRTLYRQYGRIIEYPESEWEQTGTITVYNGRNLIPNWGAYIIPKDAKIGESFYVQTVLEDIIATDFWGPILAQDEIARWNGNDLEIDLERYKEIHLIG